MNYKSFLYLSCHNHGSNERIEKISSSILRHTIVLLKSFGWSIAHLKYFVKPWLYFPRFEILLSDRCPLDCRSCIHFIPDYKEHIEEPADLIIKDMEKLLGAISHIDELAISGGDSFLYQDLDKIVAFLLESDKIDKIKVAATGAVCPTESVLKLIKNPKLIITVDNFGECSTKLKEIEELNLPNIVIGEESKAWPDFGDGSCRNRSESELSIQYDACNTERPCLLKGKVFACPRSARGVDLGFFDNSKDEYFELRDAENSEQILEGIRKLRSLKYLTACNHCNKATKDYVKRDAAERLK